MTHRLAYARRTLLQQLFVEKHARDAVSEADARRIYDEQAAAIKPEEEVRVRHILVGSEAKAKELRAVLVKGADFATLAKAQSTDPRSAQQGGGIGWRTKAELPGQARRGGVRAAEDRATSRPRSGPRPAGTSSSSRSGACARCPEFAELKDHIIRILAQEKARELAPTCAARPRSPISIPTLKPAGGHRHAAGDSAPRRTAAAPAAPGCCGRRRRRRHRPRLPGRHLRRRQGQPLAARRLAHEALRRWRAHRACSSRSPRDGLDGAGIKPGTQLFHGTRRGKTYSGEATTFSPQCGARKFPVTGQAAADGNSFKVLGMRPVLEASCNVASERSEVLVFEYVGPAAR